VTEAEMEGNEIIDALIESWSHQVNTKSKRREQNG